MGRPGTNGQLDGNRTNVVQGSRNVVDLGELEHALEGVAQRAIPLRRVHQRPELANCKSKRMWRQVPYRPKLS